jgi:hypothetical protein
VALGAWGGAARRIPATSPAVLAGGAAGEGLGVSGNRLGGLLTAKRRPAAGCGGGRRRPTLGALLRRAGSLARATSKGEVMGSPRGGRGIT